MLAGGNMNAVERDGDAVLRTAGPWTPTVHAYLRHLAAAGIDWVPRPLGSAGTRERLTYLAGDVPLYPLPDWVWADAVLVEGARRLRQLHDASVGFSPTGPRWQLPVHRPVEIICHNDFAPHNLVFDPANRERIVGVIDFDTCSPGPRLRDIAVFATRAVPLTADPPPGAPTKSDAPRRVQLLLDAYGSSADWNDVRGAAGEALIELAGWSRAKAAELGNPHLCDHAAGYERDAAALAER